MNSSGEQRIIVVLHRNCRPLFLGARVVDIGQARAIIERSVTNARNTIGNYDTSQAYAVRECIITNARHAVSNCNADQARTAGECIISNARHAVRNCDVRQT